MSRLARRGLVPSPRVGEGRLPTFIVPDDSLPLTADPHAVTPPAAVSRLGRLRDVGGHAFVDDDISLAVSPHVDAARIASHRQVTDAHLLAIARRHGGRLATLDRGLRRSFPVASTTTVSW